MLYFIYIEIFVKIRPCDDYEDEYNECKTIKARFHQLFIFGESLDCNQWKRDSDNCNKWKESKDLKAAVSTAIRSILFWSLAKCDFQKELIASEKQRRLERLKGHYQNTVWNKRKGPPEDWNKPLPEEMQKEYESTFLHIKSKEMNNNFANDNTTSFMDQSSFCSIM